MLTSITELFDLIVRIVVDLLKQWVPSDLKLPSLGSEVALEFMWTELKIMGLSQITTGPIHVAYNTVDLVFVSEQMC